MGKRSNTPGRTISNEEFEGAMNNKDYIRIVNSASKPWEGKFEYEDFHQTKLQCLWEALSKFDPTKKTKFTSYLYSYVRWMFKLKMTSNRRANRVQMTTNEELDRIATTKTDIQQELSDLCSVLSEEDRDIIMRRLSGEKYKEIADSLPCTEQWIGQKCRNAIRSLRKNAA